MGGILRKDEVLFAETLREQADEIALTRYTIQRLGEVVHVRRRHKYHAVQHSFGSVPTPKEKSDRPVSLRGCPGPTPRLQMSKTQFHPRSMWE